jgi:glycosyltransferase involved in cell wall biosynthesis
MFFMLKKSKTKLPISAVMVIRNEEKKLEQSLQSFYYLVSEIIVVHDGKCTDNSLKIAKKYTNKVYIKPFIGEAEPHRPFTYRTAKYNWILQLDADECLSKALQKNLADLISKKVDIYDIPWPRLEKGKIYPGLYKRALFKKNKVYFIGAPHEHPKRIGNNVIVKKAGYFLIHKVKNVSGFKPLVNKWLPWTKIQAKYYSLDFAKIPKWNCSLKDWETVNSFRIKYPVIGFLGHTSFTILYNISEFFKKKDLFYIQEALFKPAYLFFLYYYILKLKIKNALNMKNV